MSSLTVMATSKTILMVLSIFYLRVSASKRTPEMIYKPFGPKMCQELCKQSVGFFSYSELALSCTKLCKNDSITGKHHILDSFTCMKSGEKINGLVSVKSDLGCKELKYERSDTKYEGAPNVLRYSGSRLLFTEMHCTNRFYQVFLQNRTKLKYPQIGVTHVSHIFYLASKRQILLALFSSKYIVSLSVDDATYTLILKGFRCTYMAADEPRELIFIRIVYPKSALCRINTTGGCFKTICRLHSANGIAVLPSYKLIFLAVKYQVLSIGYDGKSKAIRFNGKDIIVGLTPDPSRSLVYASNRNNVYEISLKGENKILTSFQFRTDGILYHQDTLYVQVEGPNTHTISIWKFDLKTKHKDRLAKSARPVTFCVLP